MPNYSNNISHSDTSNNQRPPYTVPNYIARSNKSTDSNEMADLYSMDMPNMGVPPTLTTPPRTPSMLTPTTPTAPRTPSMPTPTMPTVPRTPSMPTPSMPTTPPRTNGMPTPTMPTTPPRTNGMPAPTMPTTPPRTNGMPTPTMPTTPPRTNGMPAPTMPTTPPRTNGMPTPTIPTPPRTNGMPTPTMPTPTMPTTPWTNGMNNMPHNNSMEIPNMNNNYMPNNNMKMPIPNYMDNQGYQNMPSNTYMPNYNPYGTPMGVPMFPLYGYDNSEDLDRDLEYIKQLYPRSVRSIQDEIDNECDKMEYDGSSMFDEYPDKAYLEKITDRIYEKVKDYDDMSQIEAQSFGNDYGRDYGRGRDRDRRRPNRLRDLISIILLNEIFNRRRRYRSRRRWF